MKRRLFVTFLFTVAIFAVFVSGVTAESIQGPTVTFNVMPELDTYYIGQKITAEISIDFHDTENYSSLRIDGLPGEGQVDVGRFEPLQHSNPQKQTYRSEITLLSSGEITFTPVLSGQVSVRGSGLFARYNLRRFSAEAKHLSILVATPPLEGRPDDYSGAVGAFKLDASVSPDVCSVGDLLSLHWSLKGEGTLDIKTDTKYSPGSNFKVYPPRVVSRSDNSVVCEQILIPMSTNIIEVAPLSVSYFDPVHGEYVTLVSEKFPVSVRERKADDGTAFATAVTNLAVVPTTVTQDISPNESVTGLKILQFLRRQHGEKRETASSAAARLCPDDVSKILFEIPAGVTVEIREASGRWYRVLYDGTTGWVPSEALAEIVE